MLSVENKNDGVMRSYSGHGMIEKHPASLTIAGVMGHELGHVNEAKNLALAGGRELISQNIQISVEFEGSRLVATSGRATTVTARIDAASSYRNTIANYELEKGASASAGQPIKNISQLKQPDSASPQPSSGTSEDAADFKAVELSSILSQQKQKLESKIQQLSVSQAAGFSSNLEAPAPAQFSAVTDNNAELSTPEEIFKSNGGPQKSSAFTEDSQRRMAAEKLVRIREQIAKIDNIIASLKIAKSVKMLDNILQAVAGASSVSIDISSPAAVEGAGRSLNSTISYAGGTANRKSAIENMINMIEESLRGMVINLSA